MPTGVFLFSDIEGSTRRWLADPGAMGADLAVHDATLVDSMEARGGVVFKHTGDGLVVRFAGAVEALLAAADGQRHLAEPDCLRAGGSPLRVRIAVHAGDAEPRGDDWFGPALNRCARLLSVGHGGQVLVSDAARALCTDRLPSDLGFVDLGLHRLRDLVEPEHIWQLHAPGLESSFAPLRSADAFPGNLPPALTRFVGREDELGVLVAAVTEHRLVTIAGPGGAGKTRLALELGEVVAHGFPGGVWLVELAALERGDGLAHTVVAALGVNAAVEASCGALVHDVLAGRPALLLLDNCEHLLDAAAAVVEDLLRTAPALRIVVTSRQPLGLLAEHVHPLGALRSADQVRLFDERSAATGHPRIGDDELVVEVCRELDGLPLAIELAAARLRSMTLAELAERLPQRFRLLSGARGGAARHRSLEAVVAWSFDQLGLDDQRFFSRLSVFVGEFDLAAAHAVAGEEGTDDLDSLALLDALVDRSLVISTERDSHSRYGLLETLRQFGAAHVEGSDDLRGLHATYYVARITQLKSRAAALGTGSLIDLVEADFPNIRAAFEFARRTGQADICLQIVSDLATYAQLHPTLEVAEWADQALALGSGSVGVATIRTHLAASSIRHYLGDWQGAVLHARMALDEDAQLDNSFRASALALLAPPLAYLGKPQDAFALAQEAVDLADKTGREIFQAAVRAVRFHCSLYAEVVPTMDDVALLRRRSDEAEVVTVRAYALTSYGLAALVLGRPEAADVLRTAIAATDAIGARHMSCLNRSYAAWADAADHLTACLRALRVALVEYRSARIPFGPRQVAAELLHYFVPLGRSSTIAVLDGAAPPVSIFPDAFRAAKSAARLELGDEAFEAAADRGRHMLHDEFEAFLHAELDTLGVEQHTSTLPW